MRIRSNAPTVSFKQVRMPHASILIGRHLPLLFKMPYKPKHSKNFREICALVFCEDPYQLCLSFQKSLKVGTFYNAQNQVKEQNKL